MTQEFINEGTLLLIQEELKSRKFFNSLQELGLDNSHYQPHLDKLILQSLGMDDDTDETFDLYYKIMERRSKKLKPNKESAMKHARKAYCELVVEKVKCAHKTNAV